MQPETLITITTEIHQLSALLNDCVSSGASVGLLAPLESGEAEDYWQAVGGECQQGHRQLLLTREEGKITGAVQISYCTRINGRHRAEVEKLMVHSAYRQRGIGWLLIAEVENQAAARQRTLLVLDTRSNDAVVPHTPTTPGLPVHSAPALPQQRACRSSGVLPAAARSRLFV